MNLPLLPQEMYVFLHVLLYLEKAVTKPPPKFTNMVSINSS